MSIVGLALIMAFGASPSHVQQSRHIRFLEAVMRPFSQIYLALISLICGALPAFAHAGEYKRIDMGIALEQMTASACDRAHDGHVVQAAECKAEHFDVRSHDPEFLWAQGDEGDRHCLLAGGVLTEKMPACTDAMTALIIAGRDSETSALLHALGDYVTMCSAKELCVNPL